MKPTARPALVALATLAVLAPIPLAAEILRSGARVTITSEWHAANGGPYAPRIVACSAPSGQCLKDTRLTPQIRAVTVTDSGARIAFPEFGVHYLFRPGGAGSFLDKAGKPAGAFNWSQ